MPRVGWFWRIARWCRYARSDHIANSAFRMTAYHMDDIFALHRRLTILNYIFRNVRPSKYKS
tara:strand:+ start:54 stop:239 length:186 start_codon:yes stop_codon:yes gene_type:complete